MILLDTCALLYLAAAPERLSSKALQLGLEIVARQF
jgi:PIN domain nuclease of toxin-antitoxin system